jgi:hypothetical protein
MAERPKPQNKSSPAMGNSRMTSSQANAACGVRRIGTMPIITSRMAHSMTK